jgi:hypothetical protein
MESLDQLEKPLRAKKGKKKPLGVFPCFDSGGFNLLLTHL